MRKPIVTLTTDFGLHDPYVGIMKGVILTFCPEAQIVDISHEVQPFEPGQGSFLLSQSWRYFPTGTVHVAVVDPGVGSARRPILVEAAGHTFIGPDNGVLAMVYAGVPHKVRVITAERYFLKPVSQTFHGRDIFAPVAACIAGGVRPSSVGKEIDDYLKADWHEPRRISKRAWGGLVLHTDRFGNMVTNFHVEQFQEIQLRPFDLLVGTRHLDRLAHSYSEMTPGEPFLIVGSSGYVEVAANQGSAAQLLGCGTGSPCELHLF
jgi:S-adenosyl-L-methionine hydrolase (adenosine-forming)